MTSKSAALSSDGKTPRKSKPHELRVGALDAYRGFVLLLIAFGGFGLAETASGFLGDDSSPHFWKAVHNQFTHAPWTDWSLWDLLQPSFMFLVGASLAYSLERRHAQAHSGAAMFGHIMARSLALVALGLLIVSNNEATTKWSFVNMLTQIGLGLPFVYLFWRQRNATLILGALLILLGAYCAYVWYPAADIGAGSPEVGVSPAWAKAHLTGVAPEWQKNSNIGHAIDVWLLNLFPRNEPFTHNPGGYQTINFIPSIATMLFGLAAGETIRAKSKGKDRIRFLVVAGILGVGLGLTIDGLGVCPIVKRIWTPSWVLFSSGVCALILGTLYYLIDIKGMARVTFPLRVAGMNAITLYLMSQFLNPWTEETLRKHLGPGVFLGLGPSWEPFARATLIGAVYWLACLWLFSRKLFIR